jgi:ELWxxDGT repeat protein
MINNIVYFGAFDGIHGMELWRSDGTNAGTYMVKDINPGQGYSGQLRSSLQMANYFPVHTEEQTAGNPGFQTVLKQVRKKSFKSTIQFLTNIPKGLYGLTTPFSLPTATQGPTFL